MSVQSPSMPEITVPSTDGRTGATPEPGAKATPRRLNLRRVLLIGGLIVVAIAVFVGISMYRESMLYVSTDNAELTGQPIQVGSISAGRLEQVDVAVGSSVKRNDVIATVSLPSQTGIAQNGQPKLTFLATADSRIDITSPVNGVVIGVPAASGATLAAGQPIISIIDPRSLWVTANVEETNVARVRVGQSVQVHVDALGTDVPGKVEAITPATAASFALLPTNNSSGNFTKVSQLVPVRIAVNLGDRPALLGSSVEVKIRVQD